MKKESELEKKNRQLSYGDYNLQAGLLLLWGIPKNNRGTL